MPPIVFYKRAEALDFKYKNAEHAILTADYNAAGSKQWFGFESRAAMDKFRATLPNLDQHFYEMFEKNRPLFEVYDVDLKNPKPTQTPQLVFEDFKSEYSRMRPRINDTWGEPVWRVLDSSQLSGAEPKISLHIVNIRRAFQSPEHLNAWYNLCKSNSSLTDLGVDWCIARNYGLLRALGSCKMGSARVLRKAAWHMDSLFAPEHEFYATNVLENTPIQHINIDHLNQYRPKHTKTHHITNVNYAAAKYEDEDNITHEALEYIIKHLPSDFCQHDISNWIRGIYICARYGYRNLAHALAKKSTNRYNKNATNIQYDKSAKTAVALSYKTLLYEIKQHMSECDFVAFRRNMPAINEQGRWSARAPETLTADVVINVNKVDLTEYKYYKTKMIKSNMMTYKSESMRSLMEEYDNILFVTNRIQSVVDVMQSKYPDAGFHSYMDDENRDNGILHAAQNPRLVVCVNSLWRVRGEYDLIVLDEIESIHDMLTNFVNHPKKCCDAFQDHVSSADCVVACDATLSNETCRMLRELRPHQPSIVIDNQYQSMADRECDINIIKNSDYFLDYFKKQVEQGKKLVMPTNCKEVAERAHDAAKSALKLMYQDQNEEWIESKIGVYYKGLNRCVIEDWNNKLIVIYTPTITTGLSFNFKRFDQILAYYTNESAPAETSLQMLFRVRNTTDKTIQIFYKHTNYNIKELDLSAPEIEDSIVKKINNFDNLNLRINYVSDKIIKTWYSKLYVHNMMLKNTSKVYHIPILRGLLEMHGVKTRVNIIQTDPDKDKEVAALGAETRESVQIRKLSEAQNIIDAPQIDNETFEKLNNKAQRTQEENCIIQKHNIELLVAPKKWSPELVLELTKNDGEPMKAYRRYTIMCEHENLGDLDAFISDGKNTVRAKLNQYTDLNAAERLHPNMYYDKMAIVRDFIKCAGFKNCVDENKIHVNYKALYQYINDNRRELEVLWKRSKLTSDKSNNIMQYVNQKLKSFGFEISRGSKSKKDILFILKMRNQFLLNEHGIL